MAKIDDDLEVTTEQRRIKKTPFGCVRGLYWQYRRRRQKERRGVLQEETRVRVSRMSQQQVSTRAGSKELSANESLSNGAESHMAGIGD